MLVKQEIFEEEEEEEEYAGAPKHSSSASAQKAADVHIIKTEVDIGGETSVVGGKVKRGRGRPPKIRPKKRQAEEEEVEEDGGGEDGGEEGADEDEDWTPNKQRKMGRGRKRRKSE